MISMVPTGLSRPSIPEYSEIADNIREVIDEVYYSKKLPDEALQDVAKSANVLGWKYSSITIDQQAHIPCYRNMQLMLADVGKQYII
jgi:hypothetical protein